MTKIPKDYIEGALYYVTARGDHNEEIFKEKSDYKAYVELLKKYKEQYGFKLFSFVLLSNHLHLLFELKPGLTISDVMHDLNANYTKYFNAKYKRKGHLFQERGKVVLAEKETYLLSIIAHMHLNPLLLNLVQDDAHGLSTFLNYPYSSHILYAGITACHSFTSFRTASEEPRQQRSDEESKNKENGSILEGLNLTEEIKEVLKKLSVNQLASQPVNQSLYTHFINNVSKDEMNVLGKDLTKKQVLGAENFLRKVQQKMEEKKSELSAAGTEINGYRKKTAKQQNLILAGSAAVILMGMFTLYLYNRGLELRKNLKNEIAKKNVDLSNKIAQERKVIIQDLEEKHQADMVSYNAMAKRLEYEKLKAKELEAKIDKSTVNGPRSTN